jgi:hypothetical protein
MCLARCTLDSFWRRPSGVVCGGGWRPRQSRDQLASTLQRLPHDSDHHIVKCSEVVLCRALPDQQGQTRGSCPVKQDLRACRHIRPCGPPVHSVPHPRHVTSPSWLVSAWVLGRRSRWCGAWPRCATTCPRTGLPPSLRRCGAVWGGCPPVWFGVVAQGTGEKCLLAAYGAWLSPALLKGCVLRRCLRYPAESTPSLCAVFERNVMQCCSMESSKVL